MTSEGFGEMFEGESADTCAEKFPLMSMGGCAEGLACADPEARTPIGASGIFSSINTKVKILKTKPTKIQVIPIAAKSKAKTGDGCQTNC